MRARGNGNKSGRQSLLPETGNQRAAVRISRFNQQNLAVCRRIGRNQGKRPGGGRRHAGSLGSVSVIKIRLHPEAARSFRGTGRIRQFIEHIGAYHQRGFFFQSYADFPPDPYNPPADGSAGRSRKTPENFLTGRQGFPGNIQAIPGDGFFPQCRAGNPQGADSGQRTGSQIHSGKMIRQGRARLQTGKQAGKAHDVPP